MSSPAPALRVLHVADTLDPRSGGVAAACSRLAVEQVRSGRDALVFARDPGPDPPAGPLAAGSLRRAVRDADCLHLHGVWDVVLFRAARVARSLARPYIVTPHGMLDPWCLGQSRLKKRLALALGYRSMLDRAAAVHALNPDEAELMRPLGLKSPAVVVPNGVSLAEAVAPTDAPFLRNHPDLADRPYVLFLGRLHHKKGLDHLAEAFAVVAGKLPAVVLVVAGPEEGGLGPFQARVDALNLGPRVRVVGPLYGGEKWDALYRASCFCLPSRQEGLSIAVLESLACGVPVVLSEACHFPDAESAGAGRVVPLDAARIATALLEILGDARIQNEMGRAGRALVESRYTWEAVVNRLDGVYESAVAGGAPS